VSRGLIPGLGSPDPTLEREIGARLDEVEAALEKAVRADSEMLAETSRYLLDAGGKRFRPMLVLLSGYFGDPTDPRLIPGSVAIELVHQATLYHDDVIDEADARHGVASANVRWDNTVAILTGDYLFARASEISTDLGTDICALLARTIATLCDGQIREVEAAGRVGQTESAHLEVIRRKTGALIATSCRLGAMLSDAPAPSQDVLEEFGGALGVAFQLSDDIMDLTSSQETLGKEPGQDLREGVFTLPVIHALGRPGAEELRDLLADGPPSGERLDRALELVREPGSLAHARAAVADEVDRARMLAERLPEGPPRTSLIQLAEFLAVRCGAREENGQ
jgi:heptaprenyl diphosphate synthase